MTRDDAADYIGARLSAYLDAVSRTVADSAGNLQPIIDDALRALGYADADLAFAEPTGSDEVAGLRLQLIYRALLQITRDLAVFIDISTAGDSFKLSQMRTAALADLAIAEASVLSWFGTLDAAVADGDPFVTVDLNFLAERDWVA